MRWRLVPGMGPQSRAASLPEFRQTPSQTGLSGTWAVSSAGKSMAPAWTNGCASSVTSVTETADICTGHTQETFAQAGSSADSPVSFRPQGVPANYRLNARLKTGIGMIALSGKSPARESCDQHRPGPFSAHAVRLEMVSVTSLTRHTSSPSARTRPVSLRPAVAGQSPQVCMLRTACWSWDALRSSQVKPRRAGVTAPIG